MKESVDDMYKQFMESGAGTPFESTNPLIGLMQYTGPQPSDIGDDGEDFMTSKEIAKAYEQAERKGMIRPGMGSSGGQPGPIEEDVHFKLYNTRREHKYTETELRQIRESCMSTIVHDYSEKDIYHLSDAQRAENDMLNEIRGKLQTVTRTYRQVDRYVEAMRIVMQAWEILEKHNYIHTKEEFYDLVAQGKIYSNSIIMPKLKRMDQYNMDLIIKYISNPQADASDLVPKEFEQPDPFEESFYLEEDPDYQRYFQEFMDTVDEKYVEKVADEVEEEYKDSIIRHLELEGNDDPDDYQKALQEYIETEIHDRADRYARDCLDRDETKRLLSPAEIQFITDNSDNPPEFTVHDIPRKFVKGYDQRLFGRSKKKKGSKQDRYTIKHLHRMLNKIQNNPNNRTDESKLDRTMLVTGSMFEQDKPEKSIFDKIHFDGSWASDDDVYLYNLALQDEMLSQHPPGGGTATYADQMVDRFIKTLEGAGVNMVDLARQINGGSGSDSFGESVVTAAKKKENKKMEATILARVMKLNNSPKFKKMVAKEEDKINKRFEEGV